MTGGGGNSFQTHVRENSCLEHVPQIPFASETKRTIPAGPGPSSLAKPAGCNMPDTAEPFKVLRLVLCTQPRSNPVASGAVPECGPCRHKVIDPDRKKRFPVSGRFMDPQKPALDDLRIKRSDKPAPNSPIRPAAIGVV